MTESHRRILADGFEHRWAAVQRWVLAVSILLGGVVAGTGGPEQTASAAGALPVVYLTFDDGPAPTTPALLDLLRSRGAHATFFVVGQEAAPQQAMVRRELAEGHAVGNHSWSHPELPRLTDAEIRSQLARTSDAIRSAGGTPSCFRPPYGATSDRVQSIASSLGMQQILWNVDTRDWEHQDVSSIMSHFGGPRDGVVILMHDGGGNRGATLRATSMLLDQWQGRARFEALPHCLGPNATAGGGTTAGGTAADPDPLPGQPVTVAIDGGEPLGFVPVAPSRLLDTRNGRRLAAGEIRTVDVPASLAASAAAVNLTVADPAADGYLQAWNCAGDPETSVVNFQARETRAGSTTVAVAVDRFCVRSSVDTQLVVDLTGVFSPSGARAELVAVRAVDTRAGAPIGPRWQRLALDLPAATTAISAVVTLVGAGGPTDFVSLLPCSQVTGPDMAPPISAANGAVPAADLVQLGVDGGVCAFASAPRHVLVDLVAEWGAGRLAYRPVTPTRVLDTRTGRDWSGRLAADVWYDVAIGADVAGITGTLTAVDPWAPGFASAVPCASGQPATSTVQLAPGAIAGATIVAGPRWCVFTSARAHALFDVTGYFAP